MVESNSQNVGWVKFKESINCDMGNAIPIDNLTGNGWMVGVCPVGGKYARILALSEGVIPQGVVCQLCDHAKASEYKIVHKAPPGPSKI